ncbi:hypothetical protein DPMN_144301 [Dreissena polymorpha]|uniref:Uncharacterized protein n=1 Tax=Dreissena polymorpha TaxID=45954 RepID=A0A9D4GES0_DREPO|nr:hypothetical protein DPMN_144301 [Dreissena polymorpha]
MMETGTSTIHAYHHLRNVKGLTLHTEFLTGALVKQNGALDKPNRLAKEVEFDNKDEDNELQSPNTDLKTLQEAWLAFVTAIRNVDNNRLEHSSVRPKPTLVSSKIFQQVMVDMYENTEYSNTKGNTVLKKKLSNLTHASIHAAQMLVNAVEKEQQEREKEKEKESGDIKENDVDDDANKTNNFAKETATRSWKILKRHIDKLTNEKNIESSTVNVAVLQQSVTLMSSGYRARQDLYERYGIVSTTLPDGSVVCENRMLSDRSRFQMYRRGGDAKEYNRPKSAMSSSIRTKGRLMQIQDSYMRNDKILQSASTRKVRPSTAH